MKRNQSLAPVAFGLILSTSVMSAQSLLPQITSIQRATNGVTVAWTNPVPNQAYTLLVSASLGPSNWAAAATRYRWPAVATHWTDPGIPVRAARFYRVMAEPVRTAERGKFLSVTLRQTLAAASVQVILNGNGLGAGLANWPVRFYKLLYETVDPFGLPITASGALYVPQGPTNALPLLSLQHGASLPKSAAPSAGNVFENSAGLMFATAGYVAAVPDYIGMGDSPGFHPYDHAKTEGTAVVDMLRAVRLFCNTNGVVLSPQLFLTGYSQGGHATMAADRELETFCTNEFAITASAPMAGSYDMSGVILDCVLTNRNYQLPCLVPIIITAYLPIYELADTLEELLAPPYNKSLAPLLDGLHGWEINNVMPSDIFSILRPDYRSALQHDPDHPLRAALRDNDLYQWTPQAPMHLYHCRGDTVVPYANSLVAYQSFTNRGVFSVSLIDMGNMDHDAGYVPSILAAKQWFDTLKQ